MTNFSVSSEMIYSIHKHDLEITPTIFPELNNEIRYSIKAKKKTPGYDLITGQKTPQGKKSRGIRKSYI